MNIDFNKLKNIKLTKEQQQLLVGGILGTVAVIYGYWTFLLTPLNKDITNLEASLKTKQDSLDTARKMKASWEEYTQRLARVQAGMQYVARRLPLASENMGQLQHLFKMSIEGRVEISALTPEKSLVNKSEFPGLARSSAQVTLISDFHRLGAFLSRLSAEDMVYNVDELTLTAAPVSPDNIAMHNTISTTLKLITYTSISTGANP